MKRFQTISVSLLVLVGVGLLVGWLSWIAALDRLATRGNASLTLAIDRLAAEFQKYRQLAVVMADHPVVESALWIEADQIAGSAQALLLATADKTGSAAITVVNATGAIAATSLGASPPQDIFRHADTPHFRRAMHGALGQHHDLTGPEGARTFYFAAPIQTPGSPPSGALIVEIGLAAVETAWRPDPNAIFFTDPDGYIFIANRFEFVGRKVPVEGTTATLPVVRDGPPAAVVPLPMTRSLVAGRHALWYGQDPSMPPASLHLARDVPVIGMRAEILIASRPALRGALWQAAATMALVAIIGAILMGFRRRRRMLEIRLRAEEQQKAWLEDQVADRTRELSQAVASLRGEVAVRTEAEAALRQAQQDLVRSGKLSALGTMAAGISHELNQPLMAMRSFAENASAFLDRKRETEARENLARISDLAQRMGRIIRNLRAFARHETAPMREVDLGAVVEAALELGQGRLKSEAVTVVWKRPTRPVLVQGGEVRLEQVILNLVSNAVDAMVGQARKVLTIKVEDGDPAVVVVRDTGPGLSDADKIFDPFYTTKEVRDSEGMGLGLSISYGIVQSFGGDITGRSRPEGGAEFRVLLKPAARLEKTA